MADPMFVTVINKLMSTQNEERKQAENLFNDYKKHPDTCISGLITVLRTVPETDARALCAVLLRKVCFLNTIPSEHPAPVTQLR